MPTAIISKCVGLVTQYNSLSVVDGALVTADNAVMRRENTPENRRGFLEYGAVLSAPDVISSYMGKVLAHLGNDTIVYDNGSGTFAAYSGSYTAPTGYRCRFVEANNNVYVTTSNGVQVFTDVSGTAGRDAGVPEPLNYEYTLVSSTGNNWLANGDSVAYRACFTLYDANGNTIRSAPGEYFPITNDSGSAKAVQFTVYLPTGLTTSHSVEIYRSEDVTGTPEDEMNLVLQASLSSTEISAGNYTFTDTTDYSLIASALPLYTNASQEGIAQANNEPPLAIDMALYKSNYMFYFNAVTKQTLNLTLTSPDNILMVSTAAVTSGSATITLSGATHAGLGLQVGDTVFGTDIAAGAVIQSLGPGASTVVLDQNCTGTNASETVYFITSKTITLAGEDYSFVESSSAIAADNEIAVDYSLGTDSALIESIARAFVAAVNQSSTNTAVYMYYASGPDNLPGQLVIKERDLGGSAFTITASVAMTKSFYPTLGTSASSQTTSSNNSNTNYAYYSKYQDLESVPALNFLSIGPKNAKIIRGFALRDSVIIITDKGIYRISGETAPFSVSAIDLTVYGIAPESWSTLTNVVVGLSNQGVVAISDTSVSVISRDIEPNISPLLGFGYSSTVGLAFGFGYESERSYFLSLPSTTSDTTPTQTYVYNAFTKAWTRWPFGMTSGGILPSNDKMYFGKPSALFVYKERKDFDTTDYYDPEYSITITNITGRVITYTSSISPIVGDVIYQNSVPLKIVSISVASTPFVVTVGSDIPPAVVVGSAQIRPAIQFSLIYNAWTDGAPNDLKRVTMGTILTDTVANNNTSTTLFLTFRTEVKDDPYEVELSSDISSWGSAWGEFPWGGVAGTQEYNTYLPKAYVYCRQMTVGVKHQVAGEKVSIAGIALEYDVVSDRTSR